MTASGPTLISSVQRALHLLDAVGRRNCPVSAKALARETAIALPTTYHLLRTLVHEGYLARVDGCYVLGQQVGGLIRGVERSTLRTRSTLTALSAELSGATYLALYRSGEIELVDIVDSPAHPRVDLWVGLHDAGHATALGKAILTVLPEDLREDYLNRHELADLTPHTVTDPMVLRRQLDRPQSRDSGLAVDSGEYQLGTACVSAAIRTQEGAAAVAVSAPLARRRQLMDAAEVLRRGANLIGLALNAAGR
ncbi:MAG TPA: IclR family transcriptional regulator C-terminal domain-containing protein [Nakamurella sp.]